MESGNFQRPERRWRHLGQIPCLWSLRRCSLAIKVLGQRVQCVSFHLFNRTTSKSNWAHQRPVASEMSKGRVGVQVERVSSKSVLFDYLSASSKAEWHSCLSIAQVLKRFEISPRFASSAIHDFVSDVWAQQTHVLFHPKCQTIKVESSSRRLRWPRCSEPSHSSTFQENRKVNDTNFLRIGTLCKFYFDLWMAAFRKAKQFISACLGQPLGLSFTWQSSSMCVRVDSWIHLMTRRNRIKLPTMLHRTMEDI